LNIPIWFAATAVMFHFDNGAAPFAAALVIAFVIAHFQNKARKSELQQLVSQYAQAYGAPARLLDCGHEGRRSHRRRVRR
jgi:uncharacterized membrane protein YraQ (UPF0718 family)